MDFGYFTLPFFVLSFTWGLYTWQDPKLKLLEKGRRVCLEKMCHSLMSDPADAKRKVLDFLLNGFSENKYKMMPIRGLRPYKKILWMVGVASVCALVCSLFSADLKQTAVVKAPHFSINLNAILVFTIAGLSALSGFLIVEELLYTRKIIGYFDGEETAEEPAAVTSDIPS
jgi:hypothetical protein